MFDHGGEAERALADGWLRPVPFTLMHDLSIVNTNRAFSLIWAVIRSIAASLANHELFRLSCRWLLIYYVLMLLPLFWRLHLRNHLILAFPMTLQCSPTMYVVFERYSLEDVFNLIPVQTLGCQSHLQRGFWLLSYEHKMRDKLIDTGDTIVLFRLLW